VYRAPGTVQSIVDVLKQGLLPDATMILELLDLAILFYSTEVQSNCVEVNGVKGVTIVGDTHGQCEDVIALLEKANPSEEWPWLFNGDYVDRGPNGIGVIIALLAFKMRDRRAIRLNRGNHEISGVNCMYGFFAEVMTKFAEDEADKIYDRCQELFNALPLAHVVNRSVFVVHGGLSQSAPLISDVNKQDRAIDNPMGAALDLLWADPIDEPGFSPSPRGAAAGFGPDVTERFCRENGIELVVRSHQVKPEGYSWHHGNRLITVFSAPGYQARNRGAIAKISFGEGNAPVVVFEQFDTVAVEED
jgi:serine/threonine-protein phosphatase 5